MRVSTALSISAAIAERLADAPDLLSYVRRSFQFIEDNKTEIDSLTKEKTARDPRVTLRRYDRTDHDYLLLMMAIADKGINVLTDVSLLDAIWNNPDVPASDLPDSLWSKPRSVAREAVEVATGALLAHAEIIISDELGRGGYRI